MDANVACPIDTAARIPLHRPDLDDHPHSAAGTTSVGLGLFAYLILMCNHKSAQAYGGLREVQVSFLIDRRGMIVAEMNRADSERQIEVNIRKALERSGR